MDWYNREGLHFCIDLLSPGHPDEQDLANLRMWETLLGDSDYKRIAATALPDGKWVSTVWLGLDHNFSPSGPPIIFETMVFSAAPPNSLGKDIDQTRYATEAEAHAGHEEMVAKWSKIMTAASN